MLGCLKNSKDIEFLKKSVESRTFLSLEEGETTLLKPHPINHSNSKRQKHEQGIRRNINGF